jgi:hypothetical protein
VQSMFGVSSGVSQIRFLISFDAAQRAVDSRNMLKRRTFKTSVLLLATRCD